MMPFVNNYTWQMSFDNEMECGPALNDLIEQLNWNYQSERHYVLSLLFWLHSILQNPFLPLIAARMNLLCEPCCLSRSLEHAYCDILCVQNQYTKMFHPHHYPPLCKNTLLVHDTVTKLVKTSFSYFPLGFFASSSAVCLSDSAAGCV